MNWSKSRLLHAIAATMFALLATAPISSAQSQTARGVGQNGRAPAATAEDERLGSFFEEVFERRVAESPIFQAKLGSKTDSYGEWDDFSDAHSEQQNEQTKRDLARLRSDFDYDQLSADAKLSHDVFAFDAEQRLRNFEFRYHHYIATQHISPLLSG